MLCNVDTAGLDVPVSHSLSGNLTLICPARVQCKRGYCLEVYMKYVPQLDILWPSHGDFDRRATPCKATGDDLMRTTY